MLLGDSPEAKKPTKKKPQVRAQGEIRNNHCQFIFEI